jgi:AAA15 family ATPase/GTPase
VGYTKLNIKNFRSIASLEIDGFKDINLFTGRNNSGKTSVLEALFLISGMSNPSLLININTFRNLLINSDNDLNVIFNNLNSNKPVEIHANMTEYTRSLSIKSKYDAFKVPNKINGVNQINKGTPVSGLTYVFSDSREKQPFSSFLSLNNDIQSLIPQLVPPIYKEQLHCYFFSSGTSQNLLDINLGNVFVNKQVDVIIEILKEIDEKIIDIRIGSNGMIYVDTGLEKLVPLNIMGDGTRRLLSIIASMLQCRNGVFLIDEIENGFHYSTLEILWKVIFKVSELYKVQLFITTHSEECISVLANVLKEKSTENAMLYRIERQTDKHDAFSYDQEMIICGIEKNFEVR